MIGKDFMTAGDATFTIQEPNGVHHTYRVQKVEASDKYPEAYFCKLLTGSDNETDYTYLGKLDAFYGIVETTAKSRQYKDSYTLRLLNRVLCRVWGDEHDAFISKGYKLYHEGRCGRCNRKLTVPSSIESGIGPECAKKLQEVAAF